MKSPESLTERLRRLPAVDRMAAWPAVAALTAVYGATLVLEGIRHALAAERHAIQTDPHYQTTPEQLQAQLQAWLESLTTPTLQPVINATGVIIHTNLGRAPLSPAALQAVTTTAGSYSNLEYDVAAGERGSRAVHIGQALTYLTGAEAATVVNNNAAGVLLMLAALCRGREVLISRGQLVEIGGGFRVPDVMAQSGALLVEVGTTNRTHLRDYAQAITERTAAILVAHHSNFKIIGFTTEPELAELAQLAQAHGLWLLYDQGSGALLDTSRYGLDREPLVQDGIAAGCDVVAFSGDKLLGGPQAGLLCGRAGPIDIIKRHPLARAVRPDKLCLAALAATLPAYVRGTAETEIPIWQMLHYPLAALEQTAQTWAAAWQAAGLTATVEPGLSTVGGGSLPGQTLPTWLVALRPAAVTAMTARLRQGPTKVVGRIQHDRLLLDPRTVLPHEQTALVQAVQASWV